MKNAEGLVSVIVPVFNVARYLGKCIESIVHQTYKNLEIILVDDGSTDESGDLCDKWGQKDSRIRVIHKLNGGLGDARNTGMKVASGEYILYVDSDDWIELDFCEVMLHRIQMDLCDACVCGYREVRDDGRVIKTKGEENKIYLGRELLHDILEEKVCFSYSVWKFMYKRENISLIKFDVGVYFEDVTFLTKFLLQDLHVSVEPQVLYNYRVNDKSITRQKLTNKHVKDYIQAVYNQFCILQRAGCFKKSGGYYWRALLYLKYHIYEEGGDKFKLWVIKNALHMVPLNRQKLDIKTRLKIDALLYAMPVCLWYKSLR